MRIDLISAFGGRSRPSKLSMRIFASGSGDVQQLAAELVGIVRERVDLLARHDRAERHVAIGGGLLAIAFDRHRRLTRSIGSTSDLFVLAAADADVRQRSRLKAGELGLDRVAAGSEVLESRPGPAGSPTPAAMTVALLDASMPASVTVAPGSTPRVSSRTVTCSVASRTACARAKRATAGEAEIDGQSGIQLSFFSARLLASPEPQVRFVYSCSPTVASYAHCRFLISPARTSSDRSWRSRESDRTSFPRLSRSRSRGGA